MKNMFICAFVLVILFNLGLVEAVIKSDEVNLKYLKDETVLLPYLLTRDNMDMICFNNYYRFYRSHGLKSIKLHDDKAMAKLSLSFYHAQFGRRPEISGLHE